MNQHNARAELRSALARVTQLLKDGDALGASLALSKVEKLIDAMLEAQPAEQAKGQEAVAEGYFRANGEWTGSAAKPGTLRLHPDDVGCSIKPFYTTPPAQHAREWVGLTIREIEWCFYDANDVHIVAARNIESLCREKNAGQPAAVPNNIPAILKKQAS